MWVKTKNYLVDSYCFRIEETKDRIEGYYWLVIAENKERNIIIGKYKTLEEAQMVLEYCWDSLTHGVMRINASADYIDRYVLHKVTEAENFDVRR